MAVIALEAVVGGKRGGYRTIVDMLDGRKFRIPASCNVHVGNHVYIRGQLNKYDYISPIVEVRVLRLK